MSHHIISEDIICFVINNIRSIGSDVATNFSSYRLIEIKSRMEESQ